MGESITFTDISKLTWRVRTISLGDDEKRAIGTQDVNDSLACPIVSWSVGGQLEGGRIVQ